MSTSGTKLIVDQIKAQLKKLIPVHNLEEISELKSFIGKELILIKLNVKKKSTIDIYKRLEKIDAKVLVDDGVELIIQFSGTPIEITRLLNFLKPFKVIEQTRSGLVSMALGVDYIRK